MQITCSPFLHELTFLTPYFLLTSPWALLFSHRSLLPCPSVLIVSAAGASVCLTTNVFFASLRLARQPLFKTSKTSRHGPNRLGCADSSKSHTAHKTVCNPPPPFSLLRATKCAGSGCTCTCTCLISGIFVYLCTSFQMSFVYYVEQR